MIDDETQISIGEKDDQSKKIGDIIEYKECFRAVDKKTVLYSTSGNSIDINSSMNNPFYFHQTYPIYLF